jgi:AcrR family transcriptional regulator
MKLAHVQRRTPTQARAVQTREAILAAVLRILKNDGVAAMTTNDVARVAGVSIGSLYQYFPDKRAILAALHDRHADSIRELIDRVIVEQANAPLQRQLTSLVTALIDAHAIDPELYRALSRELPGGSGDDALADRLRNALQLILPAKLRRDAFVFTLAHLIAAVAHAAVQHPVDLKKARDEAVRAVIAYVRA